MRLRRLLAALPLAAALALTGGGYAPGAAAASVASVTFVDAFNSLFAAGTLAGLDPTLSAQVNVTMAGTATVTCVGPTPVTRTVSVSQGSRADLLSPGETDFSVATSLPAVSPQNAQCPEGTVAVSVGDVEFHRAVLTVIQGGAVQTFAFRNDGGTWVPV